MNIYDEDLHFDPDKAMAEVRAASGVINRDALRNQLAIVQTAALVDIADSLRTLAVESAIAMGKAGAFEGLDDEPTAPDSLAILNVEAGQIVTTFAGVEGALTGESGVSEGQAWVEALVEHDGHDHERRIWVSQIVSIRNPEPAEDYAGSEGNGELETLTEALTEDVAEYRASAEELVDDIDADFDGDSHTAATTAVEALKAKRKAAKKGGKK
jgi:hypothetical protein